MTLGTGGFTMTTQGATNANTPPGMPSQPYQFGPTSTMNGQMHGGGFYQMPPAGTPQTGTGFNAGTPSWANGLVAGAPSPSPMMTYTPPTMIGADSSLNTFGGMAAPKDMGYKAPTKAAAEHDGVHPIPNMPGYMKDEFGPVGEFYQLSEAEQRSKLGRYRNWASYGNNIDRPWVAEISGA